MELVGTALGGEFDLCRALSAGIGAAGRGGHGQFIERIHRGIDIAEEAIAGLQHVVLRIHAVDGDVQRAARESIHGRAARVGGRLNAGLGDEQLDGVAGGEGQFEELPAADGAADRRAGGLHDFRAADDFHGFSGLADFQLQFTVPGTPAFNSTPATTPALKPGLETVIR